MAKRKEDVVIEEKVSGKDRLDIALKAISKKHSAILRWLKDAPQELEFISTGSVGLDYALGGGLVRGRIVEVYGRPGSGKSTLALGAVASANKMGHNCLYNDVERALDSRKAGTLR